MLMNFFHYFLLFAIHKAETGAHYGTSFSMSRAKKISQTFTSMFCEKNNCKLTHRKIISIVNPVATFIPPSMTMLTLIVQVVKKTYATLYNHRAVL